MTIELHVTSGSHHLTVAGGEPVIFHCHHYNTVLQQSLEDAGTMIDTPTLLRDGGAIPTYAQMRTLFEGKDTKECLAFAAKHFGVCGFGALDLSGLAKDGGTAKLANSHYVLGFSSQKHTGKREKPACYFAAGYIQGAAAAAFQQAANAYEVVETQCAALGHAHCVFEVKRASKPSQLPTSPGAGKYPNPMPERPKVSTTVDEGKILAALSQLKLEGNEEGLLPAFGVYLGRHYANYYNYISYELERRVHAKDPHLTEAVHSLLTEAGHVCAFNTFGGIMTSPEWDALILPMIQQRTDWVHGITACINALGWGRYTAVEVRDGESMVMRVDGSYESNYYLSVYGTSTEAQCHFVRGAVAGIMNLLYTGDITKKPTLDLDYYEKLFSGPESFRARETKCRSKGDSHCEFVAERVKHR